MVDHIIKPQGRSVLRIIVNMDAKGQIQYQAEEPGAIVPRGIHPLTLAQVFTTLAAQVVGLTVAAFQKGNKPAEPQGGDDDATQTTH